MRSARCRRRQLLGCLWVAGLLTVVGPALAQGDLWQGLEIEDLDGRRWNRDRLAGKIVLVDFWATWCTPCLAEVPHLQKAYGEFRDRGFEILGIALDRGEARRVRSWLERQQVSWPQAHEPRGFAGRLARRFAVESLPRSFLFDRAGRLVAVDLRGEALVAVVESLVATSATGM